MRFVQETLDACRGIFRRWRSAQQRPVASLTAEETLLIGRWIMRNGQMVGDDTCARIEALVRSGLRCIGRDSNGWDALYVDHRDDRLWELTYPQGQMHGGGPRELRCLTEAEARRKYNHVMAPPN